MRQLSKSKIIAYRQCPKRLWLELHRPELRDDSGCAHPSARPQRERQFPQWLDSHHNAHWMFEIGLWTPIPTGQDFIVHVGVDRFSEWSPTAGLSLYSTDSLSTVSSATSKIVKGGETFLALFFACSTTLLIAISF